PWAQQRPTTAIPPNQTFVMPYMIPQGRGAGTRACRAETHLGASSYLLLLRRKPRHPNPLLSLDKPKAKTSMLHLLDAIHISEPNVIVIELRPVLPHP